MLKGPFIFDSHAILKFLQKEKGHEKVACLLEDIKKKDGIKYINAINLGEIIYYQKGVWRPEEVGGAGKYRKVKFYNPAGNERPDIPGSRI